MRVVLLLTARCNAGCAHCSAGCGPNRTEHLSRGQIFQVMEEAARVSAGKPLMFALSGGEPFLDLQLLLDVIRHGKAAGATNVTCVTNAYWATSLEKARTVLGSVQAAGLSGLGVSVSRFHEPFVKQSRVATALEASREVGLSCGIKYVRGQTDAHTDRAVDAWARSHGAEHVEVIELLPSLRDGVTLPDAEYRRRPGVPKGPCPASVLTVREQGEAYTCCAPGSDRPLLALGNATVLGFERISDRYQLGGVQQVLRRHGPAYFAREVTRRGFGTRLRSRYAGICDLCTHIAQDRVMASVASEAAAAFEVRMCEELVGQLSMEAG